MDSIDHAIIAELRRDGRISNQDLARAVGLTPAPCLRRVRHMEAEGIIRGYHADIDPAAVGQGFEVIILVNIENNNHEATSGFEKRILAMDEVVEFRRMFSQPDYVVRARFADIEAYEKWMTNEFHRDPAIMRIHSHITMKVLKDEK
ncbi:Lrp/AsnC family transcriptional regulator [Corynebacterium auriscanis]|uniref:Lrp/AsnC family transcriptional regulator n=1 Tax=Corynebacterium auriscanis TaxID=99807 RepID=UPI003CEA63F4